MPELSVEGRGDIYLALVPTATGHQLVELHGSCPSRATRSSARLRKGEFVVVAVGTSPLPGDERACVFVEPAEAAAKDLDARPRRPSRATIRAWSATLAPSHRRGASWSSAGHRAPEAERWAGVAEWPRRRPARRVACRPDVHPFLLDARDGDLLGYGEVWVDAEEDEAELARLRDRPRRFEAGVMADCSSAPRPTEARRLGFSRDLASRRPRERPGDRLLPRAGFIRASADEEAAFNVGQP